MKSTHTLVLSILAAFACGALCMFMALQSYPIKSTVLPDSLSDDYTSNEMVQLSSEEAAAASSLAEEDRQEDLLQHQPNIFRGLTKPTLVMEQKTDVNGDGKADAISLKQSASQSSTFVLTVNSVTMNIDTTNMGEVDGFAIVDVDPTDTQKEIAVHAINGPNLETGVYRLVRFDGTKLVELTMMENFSDYVLFEAKNTVVVPTFFSFWSGVERLDLSQKSFSPVPQDLYYVGLYVRATVPFTMFQKRDGKTVMQTIQKGEMLQILAADLNGAMCDVPGQQCGWYLIHSERTGLTGWADINAFRENVEGTVWAG